MLLHLSIRMADRTPSAWSDAALIIYDRLGICTDPAVYYSLLEVLRACLAKHPKFAAALLVHLAAELRKHESSAAPKRPPAAARLDADICMLLLYQPALRNQALNAIMRAVSHGIMTKEEVSNIIEFCGPCLLVGIAKEYLRCCAMQILKCYN